MLSSGGVGVGVGATVGGGGGGVASTCATCFVAAVNSAASFADTYFPPPAFAMHSSWARSFASILNPMTLILTFTPLSCASFAAAHGSALQVSSPSVIKITVFYCPSLPSISLATSAIVLLCVVFTFVFSSFTFAGLVLRVT